MTNLGHPLDQITLSDPFETVNEMTEFSDVIDQFVGFPEAQIQVDFKIWTGNALRTPEGRATLSQVLRSFERASGEA